MKSKKLVLNCCILGGMIIIIVLAQFLQPGNVKTLASPVETQSVFLPVVMKNFPKIYQFGVHSEYYTSIVDQKQHRQTTIGCASGHSPGI